MDVKEFMQYMKQFRKEHPDQVIIVDTPDYHARMRISDILIYEGMRGEIIFDNE